ncbi:glycosyltransferase family 2 protein [Polymorphobacter sp.]|uniref:glycosyltransferase family 2 protein n=1 Tax=Polymorphobacter sp. TaxID=1909290 RepID=UPI003F6E6FA0
MTIGLPVLNGAATLPRALDSLLAQTHEDFRLVISDNASTDETPAIIADYAARDRRVQVLRREKLVSPIENFGGLVLGAQTPFFMFATDDDIWRPRFIEATLAALRADPGASLCVSRIAFLDDGIEGLLSSGTGPLTGTAAERLDAYLRDVGENGRYYGLHRTEALAAGFRDLQPMPAFDWLALIPSVLAGRHLELPEVLLLRERTPIANYRVWAQRLEPRLIGRVMPHWRMARAARSLLPAEMRDSAGPALWRLAIASASNSPYAPVRAAYAAALGLRRLLR